MTIFRKTYVLGSWRTWDDDLAAHVEDFRSRFQVSPNILLANPITLARIDMAARKDHVISDEGEPAPEGEHTPLYSFVGDGYELIFCIDQALPDRYLSLIYDSDPDDGGEPVPDQDTDDAADAARPTGTGPGASRAHDGCPWARPWRSRAPISVAPTLKWPPPTARSWSSRWP